MRNVERRINQTVILPGNAKGTVVRKSYVDEKTMKDVPIDEGRALLEVNVEGQGLTEIWQDKTMADEDFIINFGLGYDPDLSEATTVPARDAHTHKGCLVAATLDGATNILQITGERRPGGFVAITDDGHKQLLGADPNETFKVLPPF